MEFNNSSNNNGGKEQQQQKSARKRKLNELANDEDKPEPTDEDQQQGLENCSKKNRGGQRRNDALEKLYLESLTREELIQLVQKQLDEKNEAKETTTKQAEEFSQRILQLEQEKAEVHENLNKKMAEIVEMHKEVEEKSEELAEKAKQIDVLLMQLKESTSHEHQVGLPPQEQMKIQLSLETWYDMLAFVPRHGLGQIVPEIGDRQFASIIQKFLHIFREITIDRIHIVAPCAVDPDGHPRVQVWQNYRALKIKLAEAQMPANIKTFYYFQLSYFDQSVLNFMQKFQQNGLLDNVNLVFDNLPSKDILQPVLSHLLPLINGILSIDLTNSAQLIDIYDAGNSKEVYEMNMKMMEEARMLGASYDPQNLHATMVDLYCRWLYQTARADGKPRVLYFRRMNMDMGSAPISLFIDRLKQDFLMATDAATFLIRINVPKAFQPLEDIFLENDKTKERLLIKMEKSKWGEVILLISRYPLASTKKWIVENEKEVLKWEFDADKTIQLCRELKDVAI